MESSPQQFFCVDCESTYAVYGYPCTAYSSPPRPKRHMPDEFRHEEPRGAKRTRTSRDDDLAYMPGPSAPWYPPTPEATAFEARGSLTRALSDTPVVSTDSYPFVTSYEPIPKIRGTLPGVGAVLAQAYGNAWVSSTDEISGPALPPMLGRLDSEKGPRYAASRVHTWSNGGIISPPLEGASRHVSEYMPVGPLSGRAAQSPTPGKTSCRGRSGVKQKSPRVPENCPSRRNNKKYTIEEGDYIVYAREDLRLSWKRVTEAFVNLFHEGRRERNRPGIEGVYYRSNGKIPDCYSDGRLVFEWDDKKKKYEHRLNPVMCREKENGKKDSTRTGLGLGHRHPERGMDYEWVRPDHRRQFQDWGNKRKAQFEDIRQGKRPT
ncbi:hypothetical protein E4U31_001965 [Claviceps sp. LM219 group G6]|nr:hypothetical protein E4U31_001965 [Claviceps sp. LM219 group G6]